MVEKYIIMCGGEYKGWETPRQLSVINGEELVARTIRLLKENGIKDINISSNNPIFEKFGIPVLKHDNFYVGAGFRSVQGDWFNCFYPTDEPVCYLFGDVCYSEEAIKKIVETQTDDIEFFGSKQPFDERYIKTHEEPFGFKVFNQKHLHEAIEKTRELDKEHKFWRKPIAWELWTIIKNTPLQVKPGDYPADYIAINDYTCDVDFKEDIIKLNRVLGGNKMIKCEVIKDFTLGKFNELENIKRIRDYGEEGRLYIGDTFECDEEMCDYLSGKNLKGEVVIKIIEVVPDFKKEEPKEKLPTNQTGEEITQDDEKPKKTTKKKKTSKK